MRAIYSLLSVYMKGVVFVRGGGETNEKHREDGRERQVWRRDRKIYKPVEDKNR